MRRSTARPALRLLVLGFVAALALAGCAAATERSAPVAVAAELDPADWAAVIEAARGTTLDWYMYTGDEAVNAVVKGYVAPRLADEYGVTLQVVAVADTADAVNKVLAERQAGRHRRHRGRDLDQRRELRHRQQADLWLCGYPAGCPTPASSTSPTPRWPPTSGCPSRGARRRGSGPTPGWCTTARARRGRRRLADTR